MGACGQAVSDCCKKSEDIFSETIIDIFGEQNEIISKNESFAIEDKFDCSKLYSENLDDKTIQKIVKRTKEKEDSKKFVESLDNFKRKDSWRLFNWYWIK